MTSKLFNEPNQIAEAICNVLHDAVEVEMPEIMGAYGYRERNGYGLFRWNAIFSNLRKHFPVIGSFKRGSWKCPVLYDPESRFIITFMTEKRFEAVKREKNKTHYLFGAICWNKDLKPVSEQLYLPVLDNPSRNEWEIETQNKLAASVFTTPDEIQGHILVLFTAEYDKVLSIRATRLTGELQQTGVEEDWTAFLSEVDGDQNTVVHPLQYFTDEDSESLVQLRTS